MFLIQGGGESLQGEVRVERCASLHRENQVGEVIIITIIRIYKFKILQIIFQLSYSLHRENQVGDHHHNRASLHWEN